MKLLLSFLFTIFKINFTTSGNLVEIFCDEKFLYDTNRTYTNSSDCYIEKSIDPYHSE